MAFALVLALCLALVVLMLGVGAILEGGWDKFVKSFWEGWNQGRNT